MDKAVMLSFEELKKAIMESVGTSNHSKIFEVYTNTLGFTVGKLLRQNKHPIAFKT